MNDIKSSVADLKEVLLKTKEFAKRKKAAELLAELDTPAARQALMKGILTSRSVCFHAAQMLETLHDPDAYLTLLASFKECKSHRYFDTAHHVVKAIGSTGQLPASDLLVDCLVSNDSFYRISYLRSAIAVGLANLNDVRAVALLEDMIAEDDPAAYGAFEGLGIIKRRSSIAVLEEKMEGKEKGRIVRALLAMGDPLVCLRLLRNAADDSSAYLAVMALANTGNAESDKELLAMLSKMGEEKRHRLLLSYVSAIAKVGGPRATAVLLDVFLSGADRTRTFVAGHLAATGDDAAMQAILDAIKNAEAITRGGQALLSALGRSPTVSARKIVAQLVDSSDERIAVSAQMLLKTSLHPDFLVESELDEDENATLVAALKSSDWKARYRATVKLGKSGPVDNPDTISALITLLGDDVATVCWASVRTLERASGDTRTALQEALGNDNPEIRGWAAVLL
ncbi:MAG: HEAT repeat domain-containing protein, partial [Planctomycetaceae bacterium]